ncbi:MAG: diadenylate cyclase [Candidatus Izimaplasma sp.]|nr:diadenylate cyclase [Candidatus Izimaplasma bacterium]
MTKFDILIINIYLISIFANIVKTKTHVYIYRTLKLFVVVLFGYAFYAIFQLSLPYTEVLLKGFPLLILFIITIQTEVSLVLKKLGFNKTALFKNTVEDKIKIELIKSLDYLSNKKIGALITFEKNTTLQDFIDPAFEIGAKLNSDLLSTIFVPGTPLHDGGVIVRGDEIVCAGAYYTPTERIDIPKQLGSRHRAAIGISESTDSLTVVVSEQTGRISVAVDGYLDLDVSKESLLLYMDQHFQQ